MTEPKPNAGTAQSLSKPASTQSIGQTINLDDQKGKFQPKTEGEHSRKALRNWMIGIFLGLNAATMFLLYWVHWHDYKSHSATPIVTSGVLMSLIGATAVQVGAAMLAIVNFFFKGPPES